MKYYIILLITLSLLCSCANSPYSPDAPSKAQMEEAIANLDALEDHYNLFELGGNALDRQSWYLIGLHKKGFLTEQKVINFCNTLEMCKVYKGLYRRPDLHTYCHKDSYILTALALHYAKQYHSCASDQLGYIYENRKLEGNAFYAPHHNAFFSRLMMQKPSALAETSLLVSARDICNKDSEDESSDQQLMLAMLIAARELFPTKLSKEADLYCHNRLNYDYIREIYYIEDTTHWGYTPANKWLKIILTGIQ